MPKSELTERQALTSAAGGGVVRLTVNVSTQVMEALRVLAERHGTTVTEEVRRAASVWKYLDDEALQGAKVLLEKEGARVRELVLWPPQPK